jgi:hypothetical protein
MSKKKLLVLLGSGSSVEQDFPDVSTLNEDAAIWAKLHTERVREITGEETRLAKSVNFYDLLWKNRSTYCSGLTQEAKSIVEARTLPNYERVLGDLHLLMNAVLGKPFGDPLLRWTTYGKVFEGLAIRPDQGPPPDHQSNRNFYAVLHQLQTILDKLAKLFRGRCVEFESPAGGDNFEPYRNLFSSLGEEFDLGVYNLNYDTAALNGLSDPFVGFDRSNGPFLPAQVMTHSTWDFLYHLHGSVHYRIRKESNTQEDADFGQKITWYDDLTQTSDGDEWLDVGDITTKSDGKRVLMSSLVAGGWKLDQLQEEPFLTYYSCLPRHVYEADAILIGGYGFGDPHVNSILKNTLRAKAVGSMRPPVLILDHDEEARPLAKRGGEPWAFGLKDTLRVSHVTFRDKCHRSEKHWTNLPAKISPGEFEQPIERDHPIPVAVWSWGFLAAADRSEAVIKWLSGDPSAL